MAETQNLPVYDSHFEKFIVSSLSDIVDGDRDKMLLCPIGAVKKYLSRTEQFRPERSSLFFSAIKKEWVPQNTILFWIK